MLILFFLYLVKCEKSWLFDKWNIHLFWNGGRLPFILSVSQLSYFEKTTNKRWVVVNVLDRATENHRQIQRNQGWAVGGSVVKPCCQVYYCDVTITSVGIEATARPCSFYYYQITPCYRQSIYRSAGAPTFGRNSKPSPGSCHVQLSHIYRRKIKP